MRQLLLGLLPLACSSSMAAPSPHGGAATQIASGTGNSPIVERGEGCDAELARAERTRRGMAGGLAESASAMDVPTSAPAARGGFAGRPGAAAAPPPRTAVTVASADPDEADDGDDVERRTGTAALGAPAAKRLAREAGVALAQPSGVRAGEWDDNANYRDYVKWLAASPSRGLLDVRDRRFLVVTDKDGKAVPNCTVTVRGGQRSTTLVTTAAGRALLFPHAMGLGSGELTASATCSQATATAAIAGRQDGVTRLVLDRARALPARRTIDLAFVLDTTGSMQEEIDAVKHTIQAISERLSSDQTDVRIGLVEYKDRSDCLLTRTFPFSSNLRAFSASVAGIAADGGGDTPEDMHAGLAASLDKLRWRADATARLVVVIADAPPQFYAGQKHYDDVARRAASRGIKLFTVAASGMDATGQVVMRQMAQLTGASSLFVLRGGAGPQSTGGGDPGSSCGGTHADYSSGKLDELILRKLRQELASLDADPMRIPGLGRDENAKPCHERVVLAR